MSHSQPLVKSNTPPLSLKPECLQRKRIPLTVLLSLTHSKPNFSLPSTENWSSPSRLHLEKSVVNSQSSVCSTSQEHLAQLIFPLHGSTFFTWLLEHHTLSVFFLPQCSPFFISSSSQPLNFGVLQGSDLSPHIFCMCTLCLPELTDHVIVSTLHTLMIPSTYASNPISQ